MARYVLKKVLSEEELEQVVRLLLELGDLQIIPIIKAMFRAPGTREERDEQAAFRHTKTFLWAAHKKAEDSTWWLAVDADTGESVGCCEWRLYSAHSPFGSGGLPNIIADWCPEGEERDFVTSVVNQNLEARRQWMNIPHAELGWMTVKQAHRGRGVARLLMDVGIETIDSAGIGAFLEATDAGLRVYQGYAYRPLIRFQVEMEHRNPGERWRQMQEDLLPQEYVAMWRPPKGEWSAAALSLAKGWRESFMTSPFIKGQVPEWNDLEQ